MQKLCKNFNNIKKIIFYQNVKNWRIKQFYHCNNLSVFSYNLAPPPSRVPWDCYIWDLFLFFSFLNLKSQFNERVIKILPIESHRGFQGLTFTPGWGSREHVPDRSAVFGVLGRKHIIEIGLQKGLTFRSGRRDGRQNRFHVEIRFQNRIWAFGPFVILLVFVFALVVMPGTDRGRGIAQLQGIG